MKNSKTGRIQLEVLVDVQLPKGREFTVMGIDQSLSGTGLCVVQVKGANPFPIELTRTITPDPVEKGSKDSQMQRLDLIASEVTRVAQCYAPALICMEDVTRMASSAAIIPLTELFAVIKYSLWKAGFSVTVQNQSSMKKFNFGQGNVSKDSAYMLKVYDAIGLRFHDDNQADAYMHARLGVNTVWLLRGDKKLSDLNGTQQEVLLASSQKASGLTQGKFKKLSDDEKMALVLKHLTL